MGAAPLTHGGRVMVPNHGYTPAHPPLPFNSKSRLVSSGWSLSALPPKTDIPQRIEHVRYWHKADMLGDEQADFLPRNRSGSLTPLAGVGIIVCQGFTWNESISAEPLPKAVGTEIR